MGNASFVFAPRGAVVVERLEQTHARARDEQDVRVGVREAFKCLVVVRRVVVAEERHLLLRRLFVLLVLLGVLLLGRPRAARDARERRRGASQVPRGDGLHVRQKLNQLPERRARALVPDRARNGARTVVVTRATGSALASISRRRRGRARGVRGVQREQRVQPVRERVHRHRAETSPRRDREVGIDQHRPRSREHILLARPVAHAPDLPHARGGEDAAQRRARLERVRAARHQPLEPPAEHLRERTHRSRGPPSRGCLVVCQYARVEGPPLAKSPPTRLTLITGVAAVAARAFRENKLTSRAWLFFGTAALCAHHDTVQPRDAGRPSRGRAADRAPRVSSTATLRLESRVPAHTRAAQRRSSPRDVVVRLGSRDARRVEPPPPPTPRRPSGPGGPVRSRRRRRIAARPRTALVVGAGPPARSPRCTCRDSDGASACWTKMTKTRPPKTRWCRNAVSPRFATRAWR